MPIQRKSLDHELVRAQFAIGTKLTIQGELCFITNHILMDTQQGLCCWVQITNSIGDFVVVDPFYWGIEGQVK